MSTTGSWMSALIPGNLKRKAKANKPQKVLVNPWTACLKKSWIHLVPLLACVGFIILDRLQVFVFQDDRPNVTNFLQFTAKLLELFILASISAMILHGGRSYLVGTDGIPYGMLCSTCRATDVTVVFEPSLRASFSQTGTWLLGLFIMLVVLYSPLVGPSAAILLIPNLGYYDDPTAFN